MNCIECGNEVALIKKANVLYEGIAVKNVYLRNCEVEVCRYCATESPVVRHIKKVHAMIALGIALQPAKLTGEEVRFLRRAMRMTVADWAARIEIAVGTFSRWENGRSPGHQVEKLARIDFLISLSSDLSIDFVLADSIADVFAADLDGKRDFGLVIDLENLDAQPEYTSLLSPEFAGPDIAHIEATTLRAASFAQVRLYEGGELLASDQTDLVCNGETKDAGRALAFAA